MKKILTIIINTTGDMAFTFAGFAVMYVTLSGDTRRIASYAMAVACFIHYVHQVTVGLKEESDGEQTS